MRRVKRPPVPPKLTQAELDEQARLKKKLEDRTPLTSRDFKAYRTEGVREALNDCFRFKCAYCESVYGATQPVAIEHYRPKGAVTTSAGPLPGYYWLAARWLNLLPSCTDCNSPRGHVLLGKQVTVGKGNQFPIADEARRWRDPDAADEEERLLLHPYLDMPERHLEFDPDGVVHARRTSGRTSRKGVTSIDVYALQRPVLVQQRAARLLMIRAQIDTVARVARLADEDPDEEELGILLVEEVAKLRRYCDDGEPYTTMARQVIEPFIEELLA
jgi:uncharacterized protein (TIGR02646 family)